MSYTSAREVEVIAASSLRAERGAKVAWKQVLRFVVSWVDLDDARRLWEREAAVQRFGRTWQLDLDDAFGRGSRSSASVEADRVQRLVDEWAFHGSDWDDLSTRDWSVVGALLEYKQKNATRTRTAAQGGAHRRVGTCRHIRQE